ncbi:MAG: VOC family protein [Myxococcota bacterium]|nr:VOC family protein [Myxococcota bacterium]
MANSDALRDLPDHGLSHIALTVRDVDLSIAFYREFANFEVIHQRGVPGHRVVWLSDLRLPFALVLVESDSDEVRLGGVAHLGIACPSLQDVDRLADRAREAGCLRREPEDGGDPVGYWTLLQDPDGHNVELSFGQEVGAQVEQARRRRAGDDPQASRLGPVH